MNRICPKCNREMKQGKTGVWYCPLNLTDPEHRSFWQPPKEATTTTPPTPPTPPTDKFDKIIELLTAINKNLFALVKKLSKKEQEDFQF